MKRRWVLQGEEQQENPPGPEGIPRLIRCLLNGRGVQAPTDIQRYLEPNLDDRHDPSLMPDLDRAVDRLEQGLDDGEKIFLFGDYDVDGISATVLWSRYLRQLGAEVLERVPNRLRDPYGLSMTAVEEAHRWGARLIVSADSGTTAHAEVGRASELGIDVIVADHHMPEATLPSAVAVVNPWREDSTYPFRDLSAAGVTTKILEGLWRSRSKSGADVPSPWSLLDLTALGTIADSVLLQGENRLFVSAGLRNMRQNPRPAVQSLLDAAGLERTRVNSADLGYQVVPRLNAGGRMGDAETPLELLLCDDPQKCRRLTAVLNNHNERRKRLLDGVIQDALSAAMEAGSHEKGEPLVLCSERWHQGVLGIAAARLAERFHVPSILLTTDGQTARGSGRTAGEWDLLGLIRSASGALRTFGGHRAAVGLTLPDESVSRFRAELTEAAHAHPDLLGPPEKVLRIDAKADLKEVDFTLLDWLDRMEPFGRGNFEPLLAVRGSIVGQIRVLKEKHLRFDLSDGGERRECIGFHLSERLPELTGADGKVRLAVNAMRNVFRGEEKLQLCVRDIAVDDPFGHS